MSERSEIATPAEKRERELAALEREMAGYLAVGRKDRAEEVKASIAALKGVKTERATKAPAETA